MRQIDIALPDVTPSSPQSLRITYKDGTRISVPYINKEDSEDFLDLVEALVAKYEVVPSVGAEYE